jgi:phenylacetate-CoA ligase
MTEVYFDALETRSAEMRAEDMARELPAIIAHAKAKCTGYADLLADIDPLKITDTTALAGLPVLRKADMVIENSAALPIKKFAARPIDEFEYIFLSPGPISEPGMTTDDWWRFGRALHAIGIGKGDIVQNTFSYHFTPAGMMMGAAARATGATVIPAGTGQTEIQATVMATLGVTAYAGTPDYLKAILEKGDEMGLDMSRVKTAAVGGGPLFPQLRDEYDNRGITCRQSYGTADVGHIAYETMALDGMVCDEGVIVEIVTPGTGIPVAMGEVGEVVVTNFNRDFPMIRFATGDLSAVLPGESPCGRTNMRIVGWRGRADQATKVKGMFVRPEQVATLVARHDGINKARLIVSHDGSSDSLLVKIESTEANINGMDESIREVLKLAASVEWLKPGELPNDGLVIEDQREI